MNSYEVECQTFRAKKRKYYVFKRSEKISDFLSLIGGYQALLKFEDVRIVRDMRNLLTDSLIVKRPI